MEFIRHHRSIKTIYKYAGKYNLVSPNARDQWSEEEDTLLRLKYSTLSLDDLCILFSNRTKQGIKSRAHQLNLTTDRRREILCIETKQVFKSFKELEELLGYPVKTVCPAIKSHGLVDKKYHFAYVDEFNEAWQPKRIQKKKSKKAIRCVETGETSYYLKELADKYQVYSSAIIKCCVGKLQQTGGYHWEYVD